MIWYISNNRPYISLLINRTSEKQSVLYHKPSDVLRHAALACIWNTNHKVQDGKFFITVSPLLHHVSTITLLDIIYVTYDILMHVLCIVLSFIYLITVRNGSIYSVQKGPVHSNYWKITSLTSISIKPFQVENTTPACISGSNVLVNLEKPQT